MNLKTAAAHRVRDSLAKPTQPATLSRKSTPPPLQAGLVALGALLCAAPLVRAGCPIDFEDLGLNTAVTNQYRGVTFSVQPGFWSGQPLFMRIKNPAVGTTSSGTKCLRIDQGAGFTSSEFLVMVFDLPQSQVSFTLGDQGGSFTVRSYTTTSGGAAITLPVEAASGVHSLVTVAGANIRRIEVEAAGCTCFETIDDLTFDADSTPPVAEITSPVFGECVCANEVVVRGRACEDSAFYGRDILEYKPVTGGDWSAIGSYSSPACEPNSWLYTWPTALVADGAYYLRLTVTNKCGLRSEAITVVTVSHTVPPATIRLPQPGTTTIVGGRICIDGSAGNYGCFDHYTIERRPLGGGAFAPVEQPQYIASVNNDPLASWNTANNTTPDGDYVIRATVFDRCSHASVPQEVTVRVDNTPPIGIITSPIQCSKRAGIIPVYGIAADANLAAWVLQYSDLNTHGWADIASGSSPVVNGLLANWDTTSLPACAYALRLVVTDQSKVNLDCSGNSGANQTIYMLTLDLVRDPLAQDTDGDGLPDVWEAAHGLNPNDPSDAAQDADGDGATNLAEYSAGTDPRDPASVLRITAISRAAADTTITWTTSGSHHYLVEQKSGLDTGSFSPVSPLISIPPDGPATTTFVHRNATAPSGFYRVQVMD